jgi:FKBP-type peptidyl-prolyl cis-trans isomerase FkpA
MQMKRNRLTSIPCFIDTLEPRTFFSTGASLSLHAEVVTPKTTTTIVAAPHTAKFGQSVTVSVHVTAPGRLGPLAGTVEFQDSGNLIEVSGTPLILTLNKGRASYTFGAGDIALYAGKHHLAAEFISSNSLPDSTSRPTLVNITVPAVKTSAQGLETATVKPGHGKGIEAGQTATILYTGFLQSTGAIYTYSAATSPGTYSFVVEASPEQIPVEGVDQGIVGMKVGETRLMVIPSSLAYGSVGALPTIPPNAELVFLVKLLSIS